MLVILQQDEAALLQKWGKFVRELRCGVTAYAPVIHSLRHFDWYFKHAEDTSLYSLRSYRIPLSTLTYDPEPLECITQDSVPVRVDLVAQFRIDDPKKALYGTRNLFGEVEDVIETGLYDVVRTVPLQKLTPAVVAGKMRPSSFRDQLNHCGAVIESIRVQKIVPPEKIQKATVQATADRLSVEAELAKIQHERTKKLEMAKTAKDEQDSRNQLEHANYAHKHRLDVQEAETAAKRRHLEADAESYAVEKKAVVELEAARAEREAERQHLEAQSKILVAYPGLLDYRARVLQCEAWKEVAKGEGTRVIIAPDRALEFAASTPIVRALQVTDA